MNMPAHAVPLRSARDRLIDRLGIGDTYPLSDLNVVADQLKVPFGGTAKIPVENAQAGVMYELCDPKGLPLGVQFRAEGGDGTIVIETPPVNEDVTYRIRATKKPAGSLLSPQMPRFLDETAPVKVGLDTGLVIEIAEFRTPGAPAPVQAPLLDSTNTSPRPSDARIVPFGAIVNVRVNKSQEGVQYTLIVNGQEAPGTAVTGDLGAIILPTVPMLEDAVIQVRATKTFLAAENRTAETRPLDAILHLKVIANPALTVSVKASPIVGHRQDATITIASSQQSAKYRAYFRAIPDGDFAHDTTAVGNAVTVPVPGKPNVQVRQPARSDTWRTPDGYAPIGDGPVPGTGGNLEFTLKTLADDTMVIVQAIKDHVVDSSNPASGTISSAIRFDRAAVVLVRPDTARGLVLRVPVLGAQTGDTMQVSNGQPGVFYFFRQAPGAEFPRPAYFHKRDDQDSTQNKGVGQLGLEIDFAIAADPDGPPSGSPATVFPRAPRLPITPVATGSSLSSRAMKAQTSVEVQMAQVAQIASLVVSARQNTVDKGAGTDIDVSSSQPGISYQLLAGQSSIGPAVVGTGATITLPTGPIATDTTFTVVATPVGNVHQMTVVLESQATVTIKPGT